VQVVKTLVSAEQRAVVRRCDTLYRAGGVWGFTRRTGANDFVEWHADRECPAAAGLPAYPPSADEGHPYLEASYVIAALLGEHWNPELLARLCTRCTGGAS
jgi:hypothetical protein